MKAEIRRMMGGCWLVAGLLGLSPGLAQAQSYPSRPLAMIIPNAPSGSTDLVGRTVGDKLAGELGQPVVIDNQPGAMGAIGLQSLVRAKPDGYTLGLGTIGTIAINPVVNPKLTWDPLADFAPISMIGSTPFALIANASLPVETVADLIELAKTKPGQLTYATGGVGGSQHVGMEMLLQMGGIEMLHVPYKGSGPALIDLIGGHVDVMIEPAVSAAAHVKEGTVKILALTGSETSPEFPDVPLVSDTLAGYDISAWFALFAPAGTDAESVKLLSEKTGLVLEMPDVVQILTRAGFHISSSTPEELGDFLKNEVDKWEKVVKAAGIKAE